MSPRHSTSLWAEFAWTLAALAVIAGVIWLGVMVEWARPWLIAWVVGSIVFGPVVTMMFFSAERDEEGQDNG